MRAIICFATLLAQCSLLLLNGCSPDSIAGGTSTSENGRVVGQVVTTGGAAASQVQVTLLPAAFDPVKDTAVTPVDTTDASGKYSFNRIGRGDYTIQGVQISRRTRLFIGNVHVADDTVLVPGDTLRIPGAIRIALPETVDTSSGYIYIPGTAVFVKLAGGGGSVVVDSVPAGTIPAIVYASKNAAEPEVLRYNVPIRSEDTVTVLNTSWKYGRRLHLNTTASGADITETLYGFPVLIRLTGNDLDFSQARDNGADLRFTKQDNTVLPCEIERWDAVNRLAEVWVKADTLRGNDSNSIITMYWGNQAPPSGSNNSVVFDSADGFRGVWHLSESIDTLYDATPNRCHGLRQGSVLPTSCLIGFGQQFGGSGAYIDMGNVLNPGEGNLTVSSWVRRSATGLQTIMAKSNGGSPNAAYGWSLSFHLTDQLHFFSATAGPSWGSDGAFDFWSKEDITVVDTTSWHFVAVVLDRSGNAACRVYLDGVDVTGGSSGVITGVGPLNNNLPLRIGAEADDDYKWTGWIDECVISRTARSAAWMRLCYINQGRNDRLVEFR